MYLKQTDLTNIIIIEESELNETIGNAEQFTTKY